MAKIVLDMEWNQPMRSDQTKVLENGSRLVGEIMQIGAVKLSEQGRECSTFKCNIRPKYYRKLSAALQQAVADCIRAGVADGRITELRQITAEQARLEQEFSEKLKGVYV